MPRRRSTDNINPQDLVTTIMQTLLPVHSAASLEWLADAAATAAERGLNAPFALLYFEDADGMLVRHSPASDLRRRSQQRAFDAFGQALSANIDPASAPAIAEALDNSAPVVGSASHVLQGVIDAGTAAAAQSSLGIDGVAIVPVESAGERLGALVLMAVGNILPEQARLLAQHVACAAVNLRQSPASREDDATSDVVRTVFDPRKTELELQREISRAGRYKRSVSICVIEATNMRLLRERFGSTLAQRLYDRLGERLAQHSRDIDVIGQYKASGYTMVLSEAEPDGAQNAAARLLAIAREAQLDERDQVDGLELHLACGWASAPADGASTEAIFAAAARRMYDPKTQVA